MNSIIFSVETCHHKQEDRHKCEEFSCFCKLFAMVELFPVSKSSRLALISCLKWCSFQVMKKNKHAQIMEHICKGPCCRGIEKRHAQNYQMADYNEQYIGKPRSLAFQPGFVRIVDAETSLSFHFRC